MTVEGWAALFSGISALFTAVIASTGIAALRYAKQQLTQSHESDKVRHLLKLIDELDGDSMARYRKSVAEKRLRGTVYPAEAQRLLDFCETVALLEKRGYLDLNDVWASFSYWMFNIYADFRVDIEQERRADPTYYEDFCGLIEQLRAVEKQKGRKEDHPSPTEIREFWQDEAKITVGERLRKRKPRLQTKTADGSTAIP